VTPPAFAAERRRLQLVRGAGDQQLSIDISCPHSAQQQTRRTSLLLSIDGRDRRTDGRKDHPTVTQTLFHVSK